MKLSDLLEIINYDLVIEVMGTTFKIGLLLAVFLGGGIVPIILLLINNMC